MYKVMLFVILTGLQKIPISWLPLVMILSCVYGILKMLRVQ
ncbi:unnamed protein product [Trichobilharzia regenti]|nr:unnamed protein product [Trichobilharzia regenti]